MYVRGANDNYDATSPFVTLSDKVEIIEPEEILGEELVEGEEEQWTGSSEEEDTMEEELYECKVEVKTRDTTVPTSVRTIESVVDVPGWAPITPYLNVSKKISTTSSEEVSSILQQHDQGQFVTAGVVTSPESVMTSTNLITTPDSSISLHSQLSTAEVSSLLLI